MHDHVGDGRYNSVNMMQITGSRNERQACVKQAVFLSLRLIKVVRREGVMGGGKCSRHGLRFLMACS